MLEAFEGAKERAENNRSLAKALEKRVGRTRCVAAKCGCCGHGRLSSQLHIVATVRCMQAADSSISACKAQADVAAIHPMLWSWSLVIKLLL